MLCKEFEDTNRYDDASNPIARTWIISFNQISQENPLAARLFKLMCFLSERDIPIELLAQGHDEIEADEAIGILLGYAFVTKQDNTNLLNIHCLVRLAMRNWLEQRKERREVFSNTINQLEKWISATNPRDIVFSMRALSHVRTILGGPEPIEALSLARLLFESANCWEVLGYYIAWEGFLRQTYQLRTQLLGPEHRDTTGSNFYLFESLMKLRKYVEAMECRKHFCKNIKFLNTERTAPMGLLDQERKCEEEKLAQQASQKAFELCEQYLGAEHDDLSWLSWLESFKRPFEESAKTEEFLQHFERIIQQWETARGSEDINTLKLRGEFGYYHAMEKKYNEAEEIYRDLLDTKTKVLGPENPDTISTAVSLANVRFYQSKDQEAEPVLRHILQIRKKVLGDKHPDTLETMNILAIVLSSDEEKVQLLGELSSLRAETIGIGHHRTLDSMFRLASALTLQRRYDEAEKVYRDILEFREKGLGIKHPDTYALFRLAFTLKMQQKLNEAENLFRRVSNLQKNTLGPEHPDTLVAMYFLASLLEDQEKANEAEQVYRKVFRLRKRTLGIEHPDTLKAMFKLGCLSAKQGKPQTEHLLRDLYNLYNLQKRTKGIEHPNTSHAKLKLGCPEHLLRDLYYLQKSSEGIEHLLTLLVLWQLVFVFSEQQQYERAEHTFRKCLTVAEQTLGLEYPKTTDVRYCLGISLKSQAKYQEAEDAFRDCLTLRQKTLGNEHQETANA